MELNLVNIVKMRLIDVIWLKCEYEIKKSNLIYLLPKGLLLCLNAINRPTSKLIISFFTMCIIMFIANIGIEIKCAL
jgi:hypothetical protein